MEYEVGTTGIADSIGKTIDKINSCGPTTATLMLVIICMAAVIIYLIKRNNKVVDIAMKTIPQASGKLRASMDNFSVKLDELIKTVKKRR